MNKKLLSTITTLALLSLTSCATVVGLGPMEKFNVETPGVSGANFSIANSDGRIVAEGKTPQMVRLPAGTHYMQPERYTIHFDKKGYYPTYQTLEATINPWYFGNIVFGGLVVGMLIVDPLTGAMWTIHDEEVSGHLLKDPAQNLAAPSPGVNNVK